MKKIIASILLFIITIFSIVNCFAKENINKDNLQKAFNELAEKYEGSYRTIKGSYGFTNRSASTPIKVEDEELVCEEEQNGGNKVTKKISYELSNKPKFYIEKTIDRNTTISELYYIGEEMELPIKGVIGCAIVQGVSPLTASSFEDEFNADKEIRKFNSIMLNGDQLSIGNMETENDVRVFKSGETDNFEYLDYAINDEIKLKDELFNFYEYKFTKTKKNDNEYVLKAELTVNLDADLSSIKAENTRTLSSSTNNTTNVTNATTNKTNNTSNNSSSNNAISIKIKNNTVNNTTNNKTNNVIKNTNSNVSNNTIQNAADKKAPFVGTDDTIPNLIFIGLIIVMFNIIRLKNIDKRIEEEKNKK